LLSILFGLLAAVSWGTGDFAGGLSSRQIGAYSAVFFAEVIGLVCLIASVPIVREPLPPLNVWVFSLAAGGLGVLGLVFLYQAMTVGQMSIAAPVSALLAVALPILIAAFTEGLPGAFQLSGFGFALAAVWLVSQKDGDERPHLERLSDLRLPLFAGLGFGLFFVLINQASTQATLWPLLLSRTGGVLTLLVIILIRRSPIRMVRKALPYVLVNAVLDLSANLFYIFAGQAGRMDVAAVLSSLYPGGTAILAWLILKERISRAQTLGILSALVAIALMTI